MQNTSVGATLSWMTLLLQAQPSAAPLRSWYVHLSLYRLSHSLQDSQSRKHAATYLSLKAVTAVRSLSLQ